MDRYTGIHRKIQWSTTIVWCGIKMRWPAAENHIWTNPITSQQVFIFTKHVPSYQSVHLCSLLTAYFAQTISGPYRIHTANNSPWSNSEICQAIKNNDFWTWPCDCAGSGFILQLRNTWLVPSPANTKYLIPFLLQFSSHNRFKPIAYWI